MASCDSTVTLDILNTVLCQIETAIAEFESHVSENESKEGEPFRVQRRNLSAASNGGNKDEFSVVLTARCRQGKDCGSDRYVDMLTSTLLQSSSEWSLPLSSCRVDNHTLLMKLSRPETFKAVLLTAVDKKDRYGRDGSAYTGQTALVNDVAATVSIGGATITTEGRCVGRRDDGMDLSHLRSALLSQHVGHLLTAVGYTVHIIGKGQLEDSTSTCMYSEDDTEYSSQISKTSTLKSIVGDYKIIKGDDPASDGPNPEENWEIRRKTLTEKIIDSKYCLTLNPCRDRSSAKGGKDTAEMKETEEESDSNVRLCIDLKQYLIDSGCPQGRGGYDKSLDKLYLQTTSPSNSHLEQILILDQYLKKEPDLCIHVEPYHMSFLQQQTHLLWKISSDLARNTTQHHLPVGPISERNVKGPKVLPTVEEFIHLRNRQTREAFEMKYGSDVGGEGWEATVQSLAIAGIVFDFLTTVARNMLKLDLGKTQDGATKGGTFVMYNYARLATLMDHFEDAVSKGLYPELPHISQLDFSSLREDEEWLLLFNYILPYPSIVHGCVGVAADGHLRGGSLDTRNRDMTAAVGEPRAQIDTHRICNFLLSLSRDLSSYYGRTHVLGEPFPHLLPTMYCRLYLLKGVQAVMSSAFKLLGIQPLNQM